MIFSPYFWVAIALSWIVVAVSVYEHEQTEFDKERAVAQAALNAANKEAERITDERESTIAKLSVDLAATQQAADKAAKNLRDNLASGASVMRFAGSCGGNLPNNPTLASSDNTGTCQLSPDVAGSLVDLASRADQTANKLNACIAAYQSLEDTNK